MLATRQMQDRILLAIAVLAAAFIHVSITGAQVLLAVGLLLFLLFRRKLYFPRLWIPLTALFVWTVLADFLSPDPWGGRAQIKKFFVFLFLPLLYGIFREQFTRVYWLIIGFAATATASGVWGLLQFVQKYRHARLTGENFYVTYVGHRITGFESHWMTFSALQLSVLSLVVAHLLFAKRKFPAWAYVCVPVLLAAIVLAETRSIWLATIPALIYLLWFWRPRMVLLVPVVAALAFAIAPSATRERLYSLASPHGETDSNRHRIVTFRTGFEMVKAHPLFGIGPEQIRRQFDVYVPSDVQRPLPVGYYGHLHNVYVQYAAERGLPALAMLLWIIGMTLLDCFRAIGMLSGASQSGDELFILHGTIAVTIGILVGGLAEYNLGDSEVLMMFVSVLAIGYAAVDRVTRPAEAFPRAPAESQNAADPAPDAPQPSSLR